MLAEITREAYETPEVVLEARQRSTIHKMDPAPHDDPERWALTWRAYLRKRGRQGAEAAPALEPQPSGS